MDTERKFLRPYFFSPAENGRYDMKNIAVIGYGVQQKKLVTGSTVQVKGDDLTKLSTTSALGALQSQSPGVTITQSSGQPGQGFKINIRGIGTTGDSSPLYVIDGVPRDNMSDLNPSDIASIQVLKDASSTAIYGSRGASGVILIETKQGKGKPSVTFDAYYGFQNAERTMDLLEAEEYVAFNMYRRNLAHLREGGSMSDPMSARKSANRIPDWWATTTEFTNWQQEMLQSAPIQNYQASASAKADMGSIFFSVGYLDQEGIIIGSAFTAIVKSLTDNFIISYFRRLFYKIF